MLSLEFIAGYISAVGSFMTVKQRGRLVPIFQLKTSIENLELLEQIGNTLEIPRRIYVYHHAKQNYALMLIRNRDTLVNKLIPILDGRIEGMKRVRYEQWKSDLSQIRGDWKYRSIQSTANQQLDSIEKINPNKQKRPLS